MDIPNTSEPRNHTAAAPNTPSSSNARDPQAQGEHHRFRSDPRSTQGRSARAQQVWQPVPDNAWPANNVERSASMRSDSAQSSASESSAKLRVESLLNPTTAGPNSNHTSARQDRQQASGATSRQPRDRQEVVSYEPSRQRERVGTSEQAYMQGNDNRAGQAPALPPLNTVVPPESYTYARPTARRSPVPDADGMIDARLHPFIAGAATSVPLAEPSRFRYTDPAVPQRRDIRADAFQMHTSTGRQGSMTPAGQYHPPYPYQIRQAPSPSHSVGSQASLPRQSPLSHQSFNSNGSSFDYGSVELSSNQGSVHGSQQSYEMRSQTDGLNESQDASSSGRVQIVLETKTASKNADERRRRNASASKRFRSKRKLNEVASKERIAKLEKDIEKLQKQAIESKERQMKMQRDLRDEREAHEHYRRERDYMRTTMIAKGFESLLENRPSSSRYKKRSRSSSGDDEYRLTPDVTPDINAEGLQNLPSRHRNKKRSVVLSPTTAAAATVPAASSESIRSPVPQNPAASSSKESEFRKPALPQHTFAAGDVYADFGYDNDKNRPPTPSLDNEHSYYSYLPKMYDNSVAVEKYPGPRTEDSNKRND